MNPWLWLLPVAVYITGLLALVALVPWMSRRADRWIEREVARALDGWDDTDDPCPACRCGAQDEHDHAPACRAAKAVLTPDADIDIPIDDTPTARDLENWFALPAVTREEH